jgi:hypothetical protein
MVGLVVAVVVALLGAYATLVASDRLSCPFCKTPGGPTPTPVSTVNSGAAVNLAPASGPAGTSVLVTLSGFGAREAIDIKLSSDRIASFTTDANGSVHDTITVPSSYASRAPLPLTVTAVGQSSHRVAATTFQLVK